MMDNGNTVNSIIMIFYGCEMLQKMSSSNIGTNDFSRIKVESVVNFPAMPRHYG